MHKLCDIPTRQPWDNENLSFYMYYDSQLVLHWRICETRYRRGYYTVQPWKKLLQLLQNVELDFTLILWPLDCLVSNILAIRRYFTLCGVSCIVGKVSQNIACTCFFNTTFTSNLVCEMKLENDILAGLLGIQKQPLWTRDKITFSLFIQLALHR